MSKRSQEATKLDRFWRQHGITTIDIARKAKLSRKHVGNVRRGKAPNPGLAVASRIATACGQIAGNPDVSIADLFDITAQRRKAS
jgi:transcriptional regulator with XRE-family HTH domain